MSLIEATKEIVQLKSSLVKAQLMPTAVACENRGLPRRSEGGTTALTKGRPRSENRLPIFSSRHRAPGRAAGYRVLQDSVTSSSKGGSVPLAGFSSVLGY